MPRIPRVIVENIPHHIVQRGHRQQRVFFSDADKQLYLRLLKINAEQCDVAIWAYCIMDNHIHLICVPQGAHGLSKCFQETNKKYAQRINAREGWHGGMWESRFKSYPMDDVYLKVAVRYVELNPVKAGMVKKAQDYSFSSAKAHVLKSKDGVVDHCYLVDEILDWEDFLHDSSQREDTFAQHLSTGRPLGDETFLRSLEVKLKRSLALHKPGRKPATVK